MRSRLMNRQALREERRTVALFACGTRGRFMDAYMGSFSSVTFSRPPRLLTPAV